VCAVGAGRHGESPWSATASEGSLCAVRNPLRLAPLCGALRRARRQSWRAPEAWSHARTKDSATTQNGKARIARPRDDAAVLDAQRPVVNSGGDGRGRPGGVG